jgi:predicted MPP superfamily phosphohydrolase
LEATAVTEITIVHLSDTHLGHDYVFRSLWRKRFYWRTEDAKLLRNLANAIGQIAPDYIVHTGDVVNKDTAKNFSNAAARLRQIFANAGAKIKEQILVIPGNHDVRILGQEDQYWGRLAGFTGFLKEFFDEQDFRSRKSNFVLEDPTRRIWFFCLDSTLKERVGLAEGEVGTGQWGWFKNKIDTLIKLHPDNESFVKIVALHHHPHPIRSGGQEQSMQLLDNGRAIEMFQQYGIQLVLHGHKHFPHVTPQHYGVRGERHYTVIGAGTATCPFLEEQSGEGNSFNVIKLKPASNLISVQRYKANTDKEYVPHFEEPILLPLFPASRSGYRIAQSRMINDIIDGDGTCLVTHQRLGIVVDRRDFELRRIAFGMGAAIPTAEITDILYDKKVVTDLDYEVQEKARRKGYFNLRYPIRQGSEPIDSWFTYRLKGGFCMHRADYARCYPGNAKNEESVDAEVFHPCDELTIIVRFPPKYEISPMVRAIDQNGQNLDTRGSAFRFQEDKLANRFTLLVTRPELQHRYSIVWQVPD